jgi:protein-S-isoprenylcysteine O-methyltransferase Ste14
MAYIDELARSGNRLFRWRSYIPILFLAPLFLGLSRFTYLGGDHDLDLLWEAVCLAVAFVGLAIRCHVAGHAPARTSGRNTRGQVADRLNKTGMYSVVRNPLYVGNLFMWLGVGLFLHDALIVAVLVLVYWLYYERIVVAEEDFLRDRFGEEFTEWAARTPVFVPRLSGWVRPDLPFSLRTVLRREFSGAYAIIAILFAMEVLGDRVVEGRWVLEPVWGWTFGVSTLAYLILRAVKKHTTLLAVEGR